MSRHNADHKRNRNTATSKAMAMMAAKNQCPKCKRKSALKTHQDGDWLVRYCRWDDCKYERGRYIDIPEDK